MRRIPRTGGWRGVALGLSLAFVGGLLVPLVTSDTRATWTAETRANGGSDGVGTSRIDCTTGSDDYTTTASSTLLQGTVAGQDLAQVAQVVPVDLVASPSAGGIVDPGEARQLSSDRTTWGDPLALGLLDLPLLDLSGLALGLPAGAIGAVNQIARVTTGGASSAGAGLVDDSGGLMLTDGRGDAEPGAARVSLATAIPAISDVADLTLDIGAVSSTAELDGCETLRRALWGDGGVTGVVRDYDVASLDLELRSAALGGVATSARQAVASLDASVQQLAGSNGLISQTLTATVTNVVGGLISGIGLGNTSANVAIDGASLGSVLDGVLLTPRTAGGVTVDLATGTVRVDLAELLGDAQHGLNDLPANSQVLLAPEVVERIVVSVGDLLTTWTTDIVQTLTSAVRALHLTVDLDIVLRLVGIPLLDVDLGVDATLGQLMAGQRGVTAEVTALGILPISLTSVTNALTAGLIGPLLSLVETTLMTTLTGLTPILTAITGPVVAVASQVFTALSGVLSVTVNAQHDGGVERTLDAFRTGAHSVSALRVQIPGLVDLAIATSSVGPNVLPRAAR